MADVALGSADRDERLGEAIEEYLALTEAGSAPDPELFAGRYPDLGDDLKEALEGLSLVRGLVGHPAGHPGRRLEAGCRLAGYRIVGELGSGGMGVVYEAVHVDLDRPVALKVLDARATRGGNGLRRFLNEAKTAAGLHHTHIVPVFDVGHVGGLCYYAMQRIEGCGLDIVLKALRRDRLVGPGSGIGRRSWTWRRTPPPQPLLESDRSGLGGGLASGWAAAERRLPGRPPGACGPVFEPPGGAAYYRWVADVGRQAAQALAYAHRRGVVHRDIKPSNLLVDGRGSVWVADFGLARRLADPGLTHSESFIGTPRYMSPEQTRSNPVDSRSDVYSLGATLYELLTLHPPFNGRTTAELFEQIGRDEPLPPTALAPNVPRDLETIVLKALAKRPADRYADAVELAEDLERFLNFEPVHARRIGPLGRAWRLARRHPAVSSVTIGATAVILAVATVAYVRVVEERDRAVQARQQTQAALRELLLSQAEVLQTSTAPNRREKGLALLKQAAEMNPDPDLRARLQAEAIAFLSRRDVEKGPTIQTDRGAGLAFNADGSRLATVSADRTTLTFWSVETGKPAGLPLAIGPAANPPREGDGPFGRPGRGGDSRFGVFAIGPRLAAAGALFAAIRPDNRGLSLFDSISGARIADLPMPGREVLAVYGTASSAGPRLVTIDRPRTDGPGRDGDRQRGDGGWRTAVNLWDPDRPEAPLATLADPNPPEGRFEQWPIPLVAVARTGDTIATAWYRNTVVSFHAAADGQLLGDELDTQTAISALALDAFEHLAVAGGGVVRLWDTASDPPVPLPSITPHKNNVRWLKFSADGTLLAIAGGLETDVEIWDPASNNLVAALPTPEWVTELAFAPTGRHLAAGQPSGVATWAIVDSAVTTRIGGFQIPPATLAFGPTGQLAIAFRPTSQVREPVRVWHPEQCPTSMRSLLGSRSPVAVFDAAGRLVTIEGNQLGWFTGPDYKSSEPVTTLPLPEPAWRSGRGFGRGPASTSGSSRVSTVQTLSRAPDGQALALTRFDQGFNQIVLWRASDPDTLVSIRMPPPFPPQFGWTEAALAPNGERLYLASTGFGPVAQAGEFQAWEITGDQARRLPWSALIGRVAALALSPDGGTLALGHRSGEILLVDTRTGIIRHRLTPPHEGESGLVTALAFSPRGEFLAAGTRVGEVIVARLPGNLAAPAAPLALTGHRGQVAALAFDATGSRLATSGEDKSVVVWNLDRLDAELDRLGLAW